MQFMLLSNENVVNKLNVCQQFIYFLLCAPVFPIVPISLHLWNYRVKMVDLDAHVNMYLIISTQFCYIFVEFYIVKKRPSKKNTELTCQKGQYS